MSVWDMDALEFDRFASDVFLRHELDQASELDLTPYGIMANSFVCIVDDDTLCRLWPHYRFRQVVLRPGFNDRVLDLIVPHATECSIETIAELIARQRYSDVQTLIQRSIITIMDVYRAVDEVPEPLERLIEPYRPLVLNPHHENLLSAALDALIPGVEVSWELGSMQDCLDPLLGMEHKVKPSNISDDQV